MTTGSMEEFIKSKGKKPRRRNKSFYLHSKEFRKLKMGKYEKIHVTRKYRLILQEAETRDWHRFKGILLYKMRSSPDMDI